MKKFVIISPSYNEEKVISLFLKELEDTFSLTEFSFLVIIINDCSTDSTLELLENFQFQSTHYELKTISLKYNVGHQEAIRQGLKYASQFDAAGYIVMDSDGEDDPKAIIKLTNTNDFDIIFVSRGKRLESISFKIGYFFYKAIFKIISGNRINFGNYSMISKTVIEAVNEQNFVHYSAFLSKLKFKKYFIKYDRRKRIDGKSKMNSNNLVLHGLKSLIEYSEELLFFFIKLLVSVVVAFFIYGGYVVYTKFISQNAISGWSSTIILSLINSILIISSIIVLGLLIISKKNQLNPKNDIYKE